MSKAKFVQLHTLTSYSGCLLNRDDAGFAKRMPFGGSTRTRISSQCLKYHWRNFDGENSLSKLEIPLSIRSRETFKRRIAAPLADDGYPVRLVCCVVAAIKELILSDKKLTEKDCQKFLAGDDDPLSAVETSQVTVIGQPEVSYLKQLAKEILDKLRPEMEPAFESSGSDLAPSEIKNYAKQVAKTCGEISKGELKKNLKGLKCATGLDAAMFGRMATSDALARGDAAIHVAHSFTTHGEESESDYFSAVDELKAFEAEGELGSGHINTTELNSGLFYGYVVIDVPLLVSNIEGCGRNEWEEADRSVAADVVSKLVHLVSTVSPGAKVGSTAPYACSECVLVEMGNSQPRTLANAFRKAVDALPDVLANSYCSLAEHVRQLDQMYGVSTERRLSAIGPVEILADGQLFDQSIPLGDSAAWAASEIRG